METTIIILVVLVILVVLAWLGLQVKPKVFKLPSLSKSETKVVPLPEGLPAPVDH